MPFTNTLSLGSGGGGGGGEDGSVTFARLAGDNDF